MFISFLIELINHLQRFSLKPPVPFPYSDFFLFIRNILDLTPVFLYHVQVEATDLDEGLNGEIRYFIDFGNEEGYFSINENTGEISLNKSIALLENQILQFLLFVTARDGKSSVWFDFILLKRMGEIHI